LKEISKKPSRYTPKQYAMLFLQKIKNKINKKSNNKKQIEFM
jgi:hypothetical protein